MNSLIENEMLPIKNSKYDLVVCELHNSLIHGYDNNSDPNIREHYLCTYISRNNNFTKNNMLYLSDRDIYYNSEVAVNTQYPGYRDEQKKFQKSAHYGELYSKRIVFA